MRTANRIASAVLGLALAVVGVLVVVQVARAWLRLGSWWPPVDRWAARLNQIQLGDWRVLAFSAGALLVGAVIVAAEVWPRRPDYVAADPPFWLSRGSVERRVSGAVRAVPGVADAHARARGKPGRWRLAVRVSTVDSRATPAAVEEAARAELARMIVPADVAVSTDVRTTAVQRRTG